MKILIAAAKPFEDGGGFMYGGRNEQGAWIVFFSRKDHREAVVAGAKKFDAEQAVEIDLESRTDLFSGKEKFREKDEAGAV